MKIFFSRDYTGERKNGKFPIRGITVEHGYNCRYSYDCPYGSDCKYRGSYRFHNLMVKINTFFRYKLGWKSFHFPIYFQRHDSDLSGTTTCPKHLPRRKDCYRCKYSAGIRDCANKERHKLIQEGRYRELECEDRGRCKLFEPDSWFDNYDKKTGDPIYPD